MLGKTHIAMGTVAGLAIANKLNVPLDTIIDVGKVVAVSAIMAVTMDIDHENSTLGRKIPIIPKLLRHRGITHTVYFMLFIYWLCVYLGVPYGYTIIMQGALFSHLLGDWGTADGITPFAIFGIFDWKLRCPIAINKIPYAEDIIQLVCFIALPVI